MSGHGALAPWAAMFSSLDAMSAIPDDQPAISVAQWHGLRELVLGAPAKRSTVSVVEYDTLLPCRDKGRDRKYRWRSWLSCTATWYNMFASDAACSWWKVVETHMQQDNVNALSLASCLPVARLMHLLRIWDIPLEPLIRALCLLLRTQVVQRVREALRRSSQLQVTQQAVVLAVPSTAVEAVLEHVFAVTSAKHHLTMTAQGWRIILTEHIRLQHLLTSFGPGADGHSDLFVPQLEDVRRQRALLECRLFYSCVEVPVEHAEQQFHDRRAKAVAVFKLKMPPDAQLQQFDMRWAAKRNKEEESVWQQLHKKRHAEAQGLLAACEQAGQPSTDQRRCFAHAVGPQFSAYPRASSMVQTSHSDSSEEEEEEYEPFPVAQPRCNGSDRGSSCSSTKADARRDVDDWIGPDEINESDCDE